MKIVLVSIQNSANRFIEEPGIGYIASYLEQYKYDVTIIPLYYKTQDIKKIVELNPDIIGFSTYDSFFSYELELIKTIKNELPNVVTFIGGYVATYNGREVLSKNDCIDYAIVGEGEITVHTLIQAIEKGDGINDIKGLIYRDKNGNLKKNDASDLICDLDCLPYMNRDVLECSQSNLVQLSTSRGCTGSCSFCCSSEFWRDSKRKRVYRAMSPKRVVDEIEYVVNKYNKNCFCFNDNSFEDPGITYERQKEIAEEIIARKLMISYVINCKTNFYKTADREFVKLLIKSGLISIFLGVESGNASDLILYNKRCTVQENNESISYFNSFKGLSVNIGFINFNPYTNISNLRENNEFLHKNIFLGDFGCISSKFKPFKGVSLYDKVEQDGLLRGDIEYGGYDCEFMDSRISELQYHISSCYEKYKILNDTSYLCGKFPKIVVAHILKCAQWDKKQEIVDYIIDFKTKYENKISIINELMYEYFGTLISAIENNTGTESLERITVHFFEERKLCFLYQDLAKMRFSFYKHVLAKYNEYKKYL